MFSTPRIDWKPLAEICRRMGISHSAGLDMRRLLERESGMGRPFHRRQMESIRQQVDRGDSLADSIRATGDYFPSFFIEMLNIGEKTGALDRVLPKLADYYDHLVRIRRAFLAGIAWPMIQLTAAIAIIGVLILALGWVANTTGQETDILGFGLIGWPGFWRYISMLGLFAAVLAVGYRFATRGPLAKQINEWLLHVPRLGLTLRLMSLSRMSWALGLSLDSGADAQQSLRLALSSTANDYYQQHLPNVEKKIRAGEEMHKTLRDTGAFPVEFLDALEVGEESGAVSETMLRLAESYQQQAQASMNGTTMLATLLVWGGVACILIFLIFRVFSFYLSALQI